MVRFPPLHPVALAHARAPPVSLLTCDLGLILELAGGFSATALAYIFRPFVSSYMLKTPTLNEGACSCGVLPPPRRQGSCAPTDEVRGLGVRRVRRHRHGSQYGTERAEGTGGYEPQGVLKDTVPTDRGAAAERWVMSVRRARRPRVSVLRDELSCHAGRRLVLMSVRKTQDGSHLARENRRATRTVGHRSTFNAQALRRSALQA